MKRDFMLKTRREFNRVYRHGRSIANKYLVLYYMPNGNNSMKVGISVSKKVGKSVVRSRVKRLIKENLRINQDKIKDGYDIIIIARITSNRAVYDDIKKALKNLIGRAKMLKEM